MSNEGKRLQFVDMVKGIAIIHMVVYHILAPCLAKDFINHTLEISLTAFFSSQAISTVPVKRASEKTSRAG